MSEIVKRDTDGWVSVLPAVGDLAGKIAGTEFVPDSMRGKPAVVAAAILYGRELDLPPMVSLRSINVIKGRPALSAEAMRAMVLAAGHDIRFQEMTNARCVIVGRRKGQDETTTVVFTMDDAKRMGLSGQQQYSKMPRQMLIARATAELCRLLFADVIGGLVADIEVDDEPSAPMDVPPPMTVARRAKAPAAKPAPKADAAPVVDDIDPEPVLDDDITEDGDIIDGELVDDEPGTPEPEPEAVSPEVALLEGQLGAQVVDERVSGAALARQALAQPTPKPPAGPISPSQMKALQAGFKECGIEGREERLAIASGIAGRAVPSANDLDGAEAKAILDALAMAKGTSDPVATLKAGAA